MIATALAPAAAAAGNLPAMSMIGPSDNRAPDTGSDLGGMTAPTRGGIRR